MQTSKKSGARHVQTPHYRPAKNVPNAVEQRRSLALLAILCILLPPIGLLLIWRSDRVPMVIRLACSLAGTAAMTFLFTLLLPSEKTGSLIRPTPVTPVSAGYGVAANEPVQLPDATSPAAPAQPDTAPEQPAADPLSGATAPQPTAGDGALDPETVVYAVTNNAVSYHLQEICDTQTNNRTLTLQEALNEGLTPCEKCVGAAG